MCIRDRATRADQVSGINCFIASVCKADPEHFVGYGTLHPALEKPDEAICQIEALGLKGVKLHPDFQEFKIDDPVMYPIYEMSVSYTHLDVYKRQRSRALYTPPVTPWEPVIPEVSCLTARGALPKVGLATGVKS